MSAMCKTWTLVRLSIQYLLIARLGEVLPPCRRPVYGVRINTARTSVQDVHDQLAALGASPAFSPALSTEFLRVERMQALLQSNLVTSGLCQASAPFMSKLLLCAVQTITCTSSWQPCERRPLSQRPCQLTFCTLSACRPCCRAAWHLVAVLGNHAPLFC